MTGTIVKAAAFDIANGLALLVIAELTLGLIVYVLARAFTKNDELAKVLSAGAMIESVAGMLLFLLYFSDSTAHFYGTVNKFVATCAGVMAMAIGVAFIIAAAKGTKKQGKTKQGGT